MKNKYFFLLFAASWLTQSAWAQSIPCPQVCPSGTKPSTAEAYWRGDAATFSPGCTTYCEPLEPCRAPRVAVVVGDHYDCALPEGFVQLEDAASVDFSFARAWDPVLVQPSDALSCTNRVKDVSESDVDCGVVCAVSCANGLGCREDADCYPGTLCSRGRCGGFYLPQDLTLPLPTLSVQDLRVDDWTGDGLDDLLVYATNPQVGLYLFPGLGNGEFRLGSQALLEVSSQSMTLGWLDGQQVVVVVSGGTAQIVSINQGILQAPKTVSLIDGSTPSFAYPFQHNGKAWLLTTGREPGPRLVHADGLFPDQYLSEFAGFSATTWGVIPAPTGDASLVTLDPTDLLLHKPNGDGTFAAPFQLVPTGVLTGGSRHFVMFGDGDAQGGLGLIVSGGSTGQQAVVVQDPAGTPSVNIFEIPYNAGMLFLAAGDFGGGPLDDYAIHHGYGFYLYFDTEDGAAFRPAVYMSHMSIPVRAVQGRHDLVDHLLLINNVGKVSLLTSGEKP